jgi:hypothetical protein
VYSVRIGEKSVARLARIDNLAHCPRVSASKRWTRWPAFAKAVSLDTISRNPPREDHETPEYHADPDEVRADLHRILDEARAAKTIPWDASKLSLYRTIFPQMTNWLPEEEAAQLRFQFMEELKRLKAA